MCKCEDCEDPGGERGRGHGAGKTGRELWEEWGGGISKCWFMLLSRCHHHKPGGFEGLVLTLP